MTDTEIQLWTSELQAISNARTGLNRSPKLPPSLNGKTEEDLAERLTAAYRIVVEERGMEYKDIPDAQITRTIKEVISWLMAPRYRSTLFLQGVPGSGKTSIMNAIGLVYLKEHKTYSTCTAKGIYDHYDLLLKGENNLYAYYKERETLLVDDLGVEPMDFKHFGTDFYPIPELIEFRYKNQLTTIITTNLNDRQIYRRYGARCDDRFDEMCSFILFPGPSFRKLLSARGNA